MQAAPAPPQLVLKKESIAKRNPFWECRISTDHSDESNDPSQPTLTKLVGVFYAHFNVNQPIRQPNHNQSDTISRLYRIYFVKISNQYR
jgi:hypothetical protein